MAPAQQLQAPFRLRLTFSGGALDRPRDGSASGAAQDHDPHSEERRRAVRDELDGLNSGIAKGDVLNSI